MKNVKEDGLNFSCTLKDLFSQVDVIQIFWINGIFWQCYMNVLYNDFQLMLLQDLQLSHGFYDEFSIIVTYY